MAADPELRLASKYVRNHLKPRRPSFVSARRQPLLNRLDPARETHGEPASYMPMA